MNQINSNKENNIFLASNLDTTKFSQKEYFLKYLQEMNLDMLDLVLSDEATYFGVPKSVFMEKLSYIKIQHELSGCNESFKTKKYKRGKNYYALLLPFLGICNKFIIEVKSDKIVKIYNNKIVKTKEELETLSQFEFFFGNDEKADFRPTTDYIMTLHNCTIAYEELMNNKTQIITKEFLTNWIHEHALLYEEVDKNYLFFKYNNFRNLYSGLKFIYDHLKYSKEANEALKAFPGSCSQKSKLFEWISKYDQLYFCKLLGVDQDFKNIDLANKTLIHIFYKNFLFKGDDFLAIYLFGIIFQYQSTDSGYYQCKTYHPRHKS